MKPSEFLARFRPGGPWLLVGIPFEGGELTFGEFTASDAGRVDDWATETNKACNVYFHVNRIRGGLCGKARLTDVEEVGWLHVDADLGPCPAGTEPGEWLRREQARIRTEFAGHRLRPTVCVFSGGGFQAYWKLRQPIAVACDKEKAAEATAYNAGLVKTFLGSDSCQSVDHIMRLPGTLNVPSKKKVEKNPARTAALACVEWWDAGDGWDLGSFTRGAVATGGGVVPRRYQMEKFADKDVVRIMDVTNDPRLARVPDWVKALLTTGRTAEKQYSSRSEAQWAASCALVRAGVDDLTHYALLTDPDLAIGQACITKGDGSARGGLRRYVIKQIEDARSVCETEVRFQKDNEGSILLHLYENCRLAIQGVGVEMSHDEFSGRDLIEGLDGFGPILDDAAEIALHARVQGAYGLTFKFDLWRRAVTTHVHASKFHAVRRWLEGLPPWDGVKRVDSFLTTYGGAEDSEYCREVSRLLLIAAVRRVLEPGCKFDEMVVLTGQQGIGKSTMLAALVPVAEWFQDCVSFGKAGGKEIVESTQGRWICEVAELGALKRADIDHVKTLLSCQMDKARLSYERRAREFPRQCVFVGTTNEAKFLTDVTGNRRFLPVEVCRADAAAVARDRDQIWTEALSRRTESIRMPEGLWAVAGQHQEERRVVDPFEEVLGGVLDGKNGWVASTSIYEVLKVPQERWSNTLSRQVSGIMKRLGWRSEQRWIYGNGKDEPRRSSARGWRRGTDDVVYVVQGEGLSQRTF